MAMRAVVALALLAGLAAAACSSARAAKYDSSSNTPTPTGSCSFGNMYNYMPALFKNGYVIAASEDWLYNQSAGSIVALAPISASDRYTTACATLNCNYTRCGECIEITGPQGTITAMIADVCAPSSSDKSCNGTITQFGVNVYQQDPWTAIYNYSSGAIPTTWRFVSCPVPSSASVYFYTVQNDTATVSSGVVDYFRVIPFNYKVGIKSFAIKGPSSGNTKGQYVSVPRGISNTYDWSGEAGFPLYFRLTSIYGETIETGAITSAMFKAGSYVNTTSQFTNTSATSSSCSWVPETNVYTDGFGGITGALWSDAGGWTETTSYVSSGCHSGSCIEIVATGSSGTQLYYPPRFQPDKYISGISFWAKASASFDGLSVQWGDTTDNLCTAATAPTITTSWAQYTVNVSGCAGATGYLKFLTSASATIYLDDIELNLLGSSSSTTTSTSSGTAASSTAATSSKTTTSSSTTTTTSSAKASSSKATASSSTTTKSVGNLLSINVSLMLLLMAMLKF